VFLVASLTRRLGGGASSKYGTGMCRGFVRETRGKRTFERLRVRWKDNIKPDLKGTDCGGVNGIHLAQDGGKRRVIVNRVI
jgi:hypothetical protein